MPFADKLNLQTIWTQIRPNKRSDLTWIQGVGLPESFSHKTDFVI